MANENQLIRSLLIPFIPLNLFLFFIYKWLISNQQKPLQKSPPSPPKLPIIGNLHQLGRLAHCSLQTLSKKYGEIMLLHLGNKPTIVISSAKLASQVYKTFDSSCSGRPDIKVGGTLLYNNKDMILAPYGNHWRTLKSISMLHLLTKKRVESFRGVREEAMSIMFEKIEKAKGAMNMSDMFVEFNYNVVCGATFGKMYREEDGSFGSLHNLIKDFVELFGNCLNVEDVIPWLAWVNCLNGFNAKVSRISKAFDDVLETTVREHEDRANETKSVKDFVDVFLEVQRNGDAKGVSIDKDTIKAATLDIFLAGTHTSSVTLEWVLTEIMRSPRVMKRLKEEIKVVTGDKENVTEEDTEKMSYMKAVIKENFRLHPPLPLLFARVCIEDINLSGYNIRKGTQILTNAWAIGRDPTVWEEPESFIPERFLDSTIDFKGQDFELIPFGSGRRGCPGIPFAMASVELALANLLHRFDWTTPVGAEKEALDVTEAPGITTSKLHPLVLVAAIKNN